MSFKIILIDNSVMYANLTDRCPICGDVVVAGHFTANPIYCSKKKIKTVKILKTVKKSTAVPIIF